MTLFRDGEEGHKVSGVVLGSIGCRSFWSWFWRASVSLVCA